MKMKVVVLTGVVLMLASLLVFAQGSKPNFSGTWTLDKEKSGLKEGENVRNIVPAMTIEHNEPAFVIKRKVQAPGGGEERAIEEKYTTDGAPNTNPGMREGMTAKSTTRWDGGKLVMETTMESPRGTMESKNTYSLSADGKTLTLETSRKDQPEASRKLVYTKQ
jgi:hypothetical protein